MSKAKVQIMRMNNLRYSMSRIEIAEHLGSKNHGYPESSMPAAKSLNVGRDFRDLVHATNAELSGLYCVFMANF